MADLAGEARDSAGDEFDGEQPVRIDRAGHGNLAAQDPGEAERAVIGLVADEDDRRRARLFGSFQRDPNELAADADILEGGAYGERPEQQGAARIGGNAGEPYRGYDHVAIQRDEGEVALVRTAFADAVGGADEAARPEGFRVDGLDLGIMRRGFRQVGHVGRGHGLCVPVGQEVGRQAAASANRRRSGAGFHSSSVKPELGKDAHHGTIPLAPNRWRVHLGFAGRLTNCSALRGFEPSRCALHLGKQENDHGPAG